MKLLKLTLYNLASLEGEHVIDFEGEPLKSADLFSIVGETGSGKSTILDAVCLALYGLAPRFYGADNFDYYNTDKPNNDQVLDPDDPRNILRKGMKECFAEVVFMARDGFRYRVRWSCSIARVNYTKPERRLYRIFTDESGCICEKELEISGGGRQKRGHKNVNNEELDRIIGLDYGQFTRTVMLAQNSFANFVKADDKDKAILLEKLTGTELYTVVARKIYEYYKEAERAYFELFDQVKAFAVYQLSDEKLAEMEAHKAELDIRYKELHEKLQALMERKKGYEDLRALELSLKEDEAKWKEACRKADALQFVRDELRIWDEIAAVRDAFLSYKSLSRELVELAEELKKKQTVCSELEAKGKTVCLSLTAAKENYALLRKKQDEIAPLIVEARKLKVELEAQRTALHKLEADYDSRKKQQTELLKRKEDNAGRIAILEKQQTEAEQVLCGLKQHVPMLENMGAILDRLTALHKSELRYRNEWKLWDENCCMLKEIQSNLSEEEKSLRLSEEELSRRQQAIRDKSEQLAGMDIAVLQQRMADVTRLYTDLEQLKKLHLALLSCRKQLEEEKKMADAMTTQLREVNGEIGRLSEERESIALLLPGLEEAYQLASSQTAGHLRSTLKRGKPCPVCGALEHPYANEEEGVEKVLLPVRRDIEQKRKRMAEIDIRLDGSPNGLRLLRSDLNGKLSALHTSASRLETELTEKRQEWNVLAASDTLLGALGSSDSGDVLPLLEKQLTQVVEQGKQARAELNVYQTGQKDLEVLRKEYDKAHTQHTRRQEDLHRRLAEVKQRLGQNEQKQQELSQLHAVNCEQRELLGRDITLSGWETGFAEDYVALSFRLQDMLEQYRKAVGGQQEAVNLLSQRKVASEALEKQLAECDEAMVEKRKDIALCNETCSRKQEAYVQVLKGKDPDEMENSLKRELNEAELRMTEEEQQYRKLIGELTDLQGFVRAGEEQYKKKQSDCAVREQEITGFLAVYNGGREEGKQLSPAMLESYFSPSVDWNTRREQVRLADEEVKLCQGQMETRHKTVEERRAALEWQGGSVEEGEKPEDVLQSSMLQLQERLDELDKERLQVGGTLMSHWQSVKQMQSCGEGLECRRKLYQDWKELNDILGNANGDKFRETAQCFTLRFLVRQANEQLRMLNRRYSLEQVRDSLGIRVIDHDRADEVRNISSLSGGETFLISLALALGLSSLSSRNVPMGNLFVDEGFGTLDSNSLNMVIDALSGLQTIQGKKVGVISHTAEMRERIRTQIRVVKVGSGGKSTLEIV